jgi:uncharacterized membrane protein
MSTLTAFKFETPDGAQQALDSVLTMQKQMLVDVRDAAIVSWPEGKKKPKTRQAYSTGAAGALGGAFWGMLFGLIFFMPLLGLAMGAVVGGLTGKMRDYGIDDRFINEVKAKVTEGTSALFLLTDNAVADRVVAEMKNWPKFEVISTNLSQEQDEQLRAEFGEE